MGQLGRHAKIWHLHYFNLDAFWSTEYRLTQRMICTSFLLNVATLQSCHVVTFRIIYINDGKIMIEQHHFGPKPKNRIINSERKRLSAELKF